MRENSFSSGYDEMVKIEPNTIETGRDRQATTDNRRNGALASAAILTLIASALWILLIIGLFWVIPQQKKAFDEFNMRLPVFTQLVMDVSMWFYDYWWVLVPFLIPFVLVVGFITYVIRRNSSNRLVIALWTFVLFAPPVLLHGLVWFSIWLARSKLDEALSR
jgi:type II secretory pathway component PulF